MKVRASIRSLAKQPGSKVVRRRGHTYVINKKNPRLKARQGCGSPPPTQGRDASQHASRPCFSSVSTSVADD